MLGAGDGHRRTRVLFSVLGKYCYVYTNAMKTKLWLPFHNLLELSCTFVGFHVSEGNRIFSLREVGKGKEVVSSSQPLAWSPFILAVLSSTLFGFLFKI
jgi:hypothetical protein